MPSSQVDARVPAHEEREGRLSRLLSGLLANAAEAFDINPSVARDCIHRASALLTSASGAAAPATSNGGVERHAFAPWQAKRVRSYIEDNLDAPIAVEELAAFTRLSTSYFFRAFKGSFGVPPHAYVIQRRMVRAQMLLSGTDEPLGQIAIACGLADQAHFSRLFRRAVGVPPGVWRRELRGGTLDGVRARDGQ